MKYIDYRSMKEFYTVTELCELYGMEKKTLKSYCERFSVELEKVGGRFGLTCHMVRHLHNLIYKEELSKKDGTNSAVQEDPWND